MQLTETDYDLFADPVLGQYEFKLEITAPEIIKILATKSIGLMVIAMPGHSHAFTAARIKKQN